MENKKLVELCYCIKNIKLAKELLEKNKSTEKNEEG